MIPLSAKDIFGTDIYTYYHAELQVRERMTGGIPKDMKTLVSWLKSRLDLGDRQLIEMAEEISAAIEGRDGKRPTNRTTRQQGPARPAIPPSQRPHRQTTGTIWWRLSWRVLRSIRCPT